MKSVAHVELVTLSDSLTSPRPHPKRQTQSKNAEKGISKVVCLDSDTESDGSYAHTFVNGNADRATVLGDSIGSPKACKPQNDSWLGLHKCSSDIKSWSPNHSLSFKKETYIDVQANVNGTDKSKYNHGTTGMDLDMVIKSKQDDTPLNQSNNLLHSLQIVPSPYLDCKLDADHKAVQLSKGNTNITLCESYSPCTSLDQGIYVDNFSCYDNSILSASPCHEVESVLPTITHDMGAPQSPVTYLSSPSKSLNGYSSPAWDDHLTGIITNLECSKVVVPGAASPQIPFKQGSKAEFSDSDDDEEDSGEYSFLKKHTGKGNASDSSDSEDGSSCKRRRRSLTRGLGEADSKPTRKFKGGLKSTRIAGVCRTTVRSIDDTTQVLDKDAEKLTKKDKQMKDREEREARKQQLREERALLRQQKQEEKKRQQELKRRRIEEEKKRKEELKLEAVERRNVEKEKAKWEKGKFALQNITALVDTQILEQGLIGGHLLTRFAEKGFKYHVVKNPVKKTVIWQMKLPSKESVLELQEDCQSQDTQELKLSKKSGPQLSLESVNVFYVLVVLEADEFLEMITEGSLDKHIKNLQELYPGFTLCYLVNKLMRHLHKREQKQYKTPGDNWTRPPVEQVLATLVTSYDGVHSRLCVDEAEVSEHIVGLTRSLAECPFKRKLTPLSLSANGDHVVKNDPNNDVIKKDPWLKALVALPKVSGSCAIAIAKKYPCMRALFEAYLDPSKTVHEKERLLQDLLKEGLLGGESNSRRVGPACSRRVYRILMAEQGNLHTDDVEEGADAFRE